jgi:cytochrome c oxidase subunit 3
MRIFSALTEKPWLSPGLDVRPHAGEGAQRSAAGVGLGVFLAVVSVVFALLTSAYLMRMGVHGAAGHGGGDWVALREPPILWMNTAVLIASSLAFHGALAAVRAGQKRALRIGLVAGGLLGIAFLVGQVLAWRQIAPGYGILPQGGICPAVAGCAFPANPAAAFFLLITGLHGLHILGGLAAWGKASARTAGSANTVAVERLVRLCARYWHFLLLVWLAMFGLLLMT